ncbi:uncharacterized protein LOC132721650 [Ruditapes philippinarum]|uniref:uncharacterized protein LOC132721650 n=1 Tax=Ruditapes philippinarum TaxID=129788 RepID=UPI00295AABAB|nr:uncharacterized protein LOC132721650 [Ruditapes philippinarum]
MNRLSRNDCKAHSRMDKVCSSKRTRSICVAHRGHDSQRKSANRRKFEDKTSQKKRRSKSALPPQSQRKSMPQKYGQDRQRKRRITGHISSRAERRNDFAFELKMYLDDHYEYMQHINRNVAENPKELASQQKNTKMSDVLSLRKPNFKRDNREADDIQCHPTKQQTSDSQTMKSSQHGDKSITDICPKSEAYTNNTRQISEKLTKDDLRNKLTDKKKTKKGFFTSAYRTFLACFGVRK